MMSFPDLCEEAAGGTKLRFSAPLSQTMSLSIMALNIEYVWAPKHLQTKLTEVLYPFLVSVVD